MRVLIALACLLALAGAASIGGIKPKVSRELERTGPNPIVQKTDADVNTVDNNVYQIADKDAPAASNEANNGSGSNRAWPGAPVYRRKFISSNGPRPDPETDPDFRGTYESNADDSNDSDSIGVVRVYYLKDFDGSFSRGRFGFRGGHSYTGPDRDVFGRRGGYGGYYYGRK